MMVGLSTLAYHRNMYLQMIQFLSADLESIIDRDSIGSEMVSHINKRQHEARHFAESYGWPTWHQSCGMQRICLSLHARNQSSACLALLLSKHVSLRFHLLTTYQSSGALYNSMAPSWQPQELLQDSPAIICEPVSISAKCVTIRPTISVLTFLRSAVLT